MYLIINADDFGLSQSINDAVYELAKFGAISSTTVMANMPFAQEIIRLRDFEEFGVGLHFNLTQGRPVSNINEIDSLIDRDGCFYNVKVFRKKVSEGKINFDHIEKELLAQFEYLTRILGKSITHIDSHQDINKLRIVSDVLIKFAKKMNLTLGLRVYNKAYLIKIGEKYRVENPSLFQFSGFSLRRRLIETYFRVKNKKLAKHYALTNGMLLSKENSIRELLKLLLSIKTTEFSNNCYEIMCHPSTNLDGLVDTKMLQSRVEEYEILKSNQFQSFVKTNKLINYSDLINRRFNL